MERIDQGIDPVVLLEAEIEILAMRLVEVDPDAILRLEKLLARVRVCRIVEKQLN